MNKKVSYADQYSCRTETIKKENPDFLFLYLGQTDELGGHENGWMSEQYFKCIDNAFSCIEDVYNNITEAYTLIVIADHGGHERRHGEDIPEDMTIPVILYGNSFEGKKEINDVSIKDISVTIAELLNVPKVKEWEGKSLKNID